jgi:hypothetical protein
MLSNIVIVFLLIMMVGSLAAAMVFMFKDKGQGNRTVKALTYRVGIWAVLFGLIVVGLYTGVITPSQSLRPMTGYSQNQ